MIQPDFLYAGALLIDTVLGDPRGSLHPVVLIGKLISMFEKILLKENSSGTSKKRAGFLLIFLTIGTVYLITYGIIKLLAFGGHYSLMLGSMLILSFTISPRALKESAQEIQQLLVQGDMSGARQKVGWIVGRDTQNLDETEVTRATVETVAENITDGIISPLFFAALGGVPLAFAYRAVNTLDSMVGYKNDRYLDFGYASARFDDVCNFVPARITALLVIVLAFLLPGYSGKEAWRIVWRDAAKHPSPNSGYAEAPVAGSMGVRLGGCNYYFGRPSFREYMGDNEHVLSSTHIGKTVFLMYVVTITFVIILTFI